MEFFIKEYVSLTLLLQTIFTVAVGFYQTVSSASYCAGATEIHMTFGPNKFVWLSPVWHTQLVVSATMSQHQKALAPQMGILGAHSTFKKNPLGCWFSTLELKCNGVYEPQQS
jgi:hypothetical protein